MNVQPNIKRKIDYYFRIHYFHAETGKKRKCQEEENENDTRKAVVISPLPSCVVYDQDEINLQYYATIFLKETADQIYNLLETEINYDKKSQVKIYGKTFDVPRKQKAYGDPGLTYRFSNVTVAASEWTPLLIELKNIVSTLCLCEFNFVLINRYKNGQDYMGEHQDNEHDLDLNVPIASLSFGQNRDFIFKHKDSRGRGAEKHIENVKINLQHGSLLIMKPKTNTFWYHGIPKRSIRNCPNPRINLTFRKMKI